MRNTDQFVVDAVRVRSRVRTARGAERFRKSRACPASPIGNARTRLARRRVSANIRRRRFSFVLSTFLTAGELHRNNVSANESSIGNEKLRTKRSPKYQLPRRRAKSNDGRRTITTRTLIYSQRDLIVRIVVFQTDEKLNEKLLENLYLD